MAERGAKRAKERGDEDLPLAESASFETSMLRLESLVEQLEAGELSLEDALRVFEEGVALTRQCGEKLSDAERRIEVLMQQGGEWSARPFTTGAAVSDEEGD
jgi:exodeoxyribonuclease VII small subunit